MMKGWFIRNYYYNDSGTDYIFSRLQECLKSFKISLTEEKAQLYYDRTGNVCFKSLPDFVIFWDKDIKVAKAFERKGVRVFNSAESIGLCDDKERTYAAIEGTNIKIPETVCAPLAYSNALVKDSPFLKELKEKLLFPMIAKENCGSQGKQVFLISNENELAEFYSKSFHTPHHYQKYYEESRGRDYRCYVVNNEVIAVCERQNTTDFKSNVCQGGKMSLLISCKGSIKNAVSREEKLAEAAKIISAKLNLDYGSIDFLAVSGQPIFLEANSNAYFRSIETLGVDIAGKYAAHIASVMKSAKGK